MTAQDSARKSAIFNSISALVLLLATCVLPIPRQTTQVQGAVMLAAYHAPDLRDTPEAVYCDDGGSGACMNVPHGHAVAGQRINMWGHPGDTGCSGCTPFEEWSLDGTHFRVGNHWPFHPRAMDIRFHGGRLYQLHYRGNGARPSRPECADDQPRHIYFTALERCSPATYWVRYQVNDTVAYISVAAVNAHGANIAYVMTASCNRDGCALKVSKLVQGGVGIFAAINSHQNMRECAPSGAMQYVCQKGRLAAGWSRDRTESDSTHSASNNPVPNECKIISRHTCMSALTLCLRFTNNQ